MENKTIKKIVKHLTRNINKTNQAEENYDYNSDYTKRTRHFGINKYLAKINVYTYGYIAICLVILLVAVLIVREIYSFDLSDIAKTGELGHKKVSFLLSIYRSRYLLLVLILIMFAGYLKFAYKVNTSFADINVGQKGTARWTTRKEIEEQYKKIAEKIEPFAGYGGIPIARNEDRIYIDDSNTNSIVIGTTRSGKDECIISPMVENLSRAENKSSMVIIDVKLETSTYAMQMLKERGYECHIINCIDPKFSAGYNPLKLIADEFEEGYKTGNLSVAQTLCVSIAHNMFPKIEHDPQPFFTNAARDLFIAGFWAMTEDAYEKDRIDNLKAKILHDKMEHKKEINFYKNLYGDDYIKFYIRQKVDKLLKSTTLPSEKDEPNYSEVVKSLSKEFDEYEIPISAPSRRFLSVENIKEITEAFKYIDAKYVPKPYVPISKAKEKITIYNLITFISNLQEKNLLDSYFETKDIHNFARLKYQTVKSAASKAKGDIISSFYEKVATYLTDDMAKITHKSTFNLSDIGFGEKPVAIFIGIPDYDTSFDFLTTIFLNQVYFINAKLATAMPNGKVKNRIHFILNEVCNFPAIESLGRKTRVGLGRDLIYTLFVQDFASMNAIYKEDATSIRSNCGNQIYIMAGDEETATEFSKLLGEETYTDINRTGKKLSLNKEITERAEGRALLTAEELTKLKKGETIVRRTMKRENLKGESIITTPIGNLGKYRMKYRYEFLEDIMPSGIRLYQSPIYENLLRSNSLMRQQFVNEPVKYANVELETTDGINLRNNIDDLRWSVYRLVKFNSKAIFPEDLTTDNKITLKKILSRKKYLEKFYLIKEDIINDNGEVVGKKEGYLASKLETIAVFMMQQPSLKERIDGYTLYNLIHKI